MAVSVPTVKRFNGLDSKTNALVMADGSPRQPGIHPITGEYDTGQMIFDEFHGGDTNEPLTD